MALNTCLGVVLVSHDARLILETDCELYECASMLLMSLLALLLPLFTFLARRPSLHSYRRRFQRLPWFGARALGRR